MSDRLNTLLERVDAALAANQEVREGSSHLVPEGLQKAADEALAQWNSK